MGVRRKYGRQGSGVHWSNSLLDGFPYVRNDEGKLVVNCETVTKFAAVHLSHHGTDASFKKKIYPWLEGVDNTQKAIARRGEAALKLIQDIREECYQ